MTFELFLGVHSVTNDVVVDRENGVYGTRSDSMT